MTIRAGYQRPVGATVRGRETYFAIKKLGICINQGEKNRKSTPVKDRLDKSKSVMRM
jgi:hypothetical protein